MRSVTYLPLLALTFAALSAGCGGSSKPPKTVAAYGAKVKLDGEGKKAKFPDFTLRFLGTTKEKAEGSKGEVTAYNFRVRKGEERKPIAWGLDGKVEPLQFKFNDGRYSLERVNSQKLGKLAEDEVVVWKLDK